MHNAPKLAVILAAGRGMRLGNLGLEQPKGFIQIGEQAIIEESIARLLNIGVEKIIIVTGHLQSYYADLQRKHPDLIQLEHNEKYTESGSMYSLFIARNSIDRDFILLESDLIYESRALQLLFAKPLQGSTILLSGETKSGDEVYANAVDGLINGLSKNKASCAQIVGELVGISYIELDFFSAMIEASATYFINSLHLEYEQGIIFAAKNLPIKCFLISDLIWCEIDCEEHLIRARNNIYPRIREVELA